MARCGCTSTCACAVIADPDCPNVSVTGNGSPGTPYEVCVDPASISVLDTETVDITITGSGTAADPYVISADALTVVQDSDCIALSGTGTAADPIVATPIIAAGANGFECLAAADPGGPGLAVIPSSDAGNIVTVGTDGRLFATGGGTTDCPITSLSDCLVVDDGACTVDLLVDPDPCTPLVCGPNGLTTDGPISFAEPLAASARLRLGPFAGNVPLNGTVVHDPGTDVQITNPSNCREMCVDAFFHVNSDIGSNTGQAQFLGGVNGPGGLLFFGDTAASNLGANGGPGGRYIRSSISDHAPCDTTLAPGATATYTVVVASIGSNSTGGAHFESNVILTLLGRLI